MEKIESKRLEKKASPESRKMIQVDAYSQIPEMSRPELNAVITFWAKHAERKRFN